MTGILVLTALVLTIIAALEISNRRHSRGPKSGLSGSWDADDRDVARSKADLFALAGRAEPFSRKPFTSDGVHDIFGARRARHFGWNHGRHAA